MKNMSESYKKAYGQVADPDCGTKMPAGKPESCEDALRQAPGVSKSKPIGSPKVDDGAAKRCLDSQLGRVTPSGGRLGDATTQPNDGVNDIPPSVKAIGTTNKNPKKFNTPDGM